MCQPAARVQSTCWGVVGGWLRGVSHPFGPASVRGGGGVAKGMLPCLLVPEKGTSPRPAPSFCGG